MHDVMRRAVFAGAAVSLLLAVAGPAHTTPVRVGGSQEAAPACVQHSAGWRYTYVSSACDATQYVTVDYRDGSEVPCRTVAPGETVTFPGYGPQGNDVLGVRICAASSG